MDNAELQTKKKAAVITTVLLVICGLVSITLNAVSVGVVENLPVSFSRSTINYGVQGSQLYQTGEVKVSGKNVPVQVKNVSECMEAVQSSLKKISVCSRNNSVHIVLTEICVETGEEHKWYFTLNQWRSFLVEVFDVSLYVAANVKC